MPSDQARDILDKKSPQREWSGSGYVVIVDYDPATDAPSPPSCLDKTPILFVEGGPPRAGWVSPPRPAARGPRTAWARRTRRPPCAGAGPSGSTLPISAASSPAARSIRRVETGVAEVVGRGEDTGRHDHRAQVGEQRPERVLQHQRVAGGARGRGDQHRRPVEHAVLEHVEERLEQPGVRRREHRRDRDQAVGLAHLGEGLGQSRAGEAREQVVGQLVGELPQLDRPRPRPPRAHRPPLRSAGRQAGGWRTARQPGGNHDEAGHATPPWPSRRRSDSWVGASGTWAGRPSANPARRSGRISPSRSSCSSTSSAAARRGRPGTAGAGSRRRTPGIPGCARAPVAATRR